MTKPHTITIDDIQYVRKDSVVAPVVTGTREVVVCERGWIFVGHVEEDGDYLWIRRAANLRKWASGGFGGALMRPKANGVVLDKAPDMRVRIQAVLSRHPIDEGWAQ